MANYVFKIIANGVDLDTFDDEVIGLSNNLTGLFDIDKIPSEVSKQITLPASRNNNRFFYHFYDIDVQDPFLFSSGEKIPCRIEMGGYILADGYLQLNAVNIINNQVDTYDVNIFGLISGFSRDLGTTFLTDLADLDVYNHTSSLDNISSSWDGGLFSGDIIYPLVDYGRGYAFQSSLSSGQFGIDVPNGKVQIQDFKPAIRTKKVIDTIFSQLGYSYSSSFLNQPMWDDIYTICDRGLQYPIYDGIDLEGYGKILIRPTSGSTTDISIPNTTDTKLNFNTTEQDPSLAMSSSAVYNMPTTSSLNGNVKLNIFITGSSTVGYPEFQMRIRNSAVTSSVYSSFALEEINKFLKETYSQLDKMGEKTYTLEETWTTGDDLVPPTQVEFVLFMEKKVSTGFDVTIAKDGNTESYIQITSLNNAADGKIMKIPQNMPYGENGITCLDFLKGIQKKYNLVIYPSKRDSQTIIIEPFNNWYNKGSVVDLTPNIRTDKSFTVTPANNLAVNELEFGDEQGKDYFARLFTEQNNRKYGTSYYKDTENQFSQGKVDVKTTFAVSPLRYIDGSGGTGGSTPPVAYPISILYNNNADDMCNNNRYSTTAYITRNDVEIQIYDTLYLDSNLTTKLLGYNYASDVSGKIWLINPSTGVAYSNPRSC